MPKRKLVKVSSTEDSDLSPPPEGLLQNPVDASIDASIEAPLRKKRAAKSVKVELGISSESKPADVKPLCKRNVKIEGQQELPNPRSTKKVKKAASQSTNGVIVEEKKSIRKRKTKEEKEAEAMPLAARTRGHKLYIGAHVSSAGGVHNSIINSVHIGANAFALFLKSQRKWANPPLADDHCSTFLSNCDSHAYDQTRHVVPHGSYLVNLAHTDQSRTEQAYECFVDDLRRCERLGIKLYNFHPGVANSTGGDRQAAIAHLASNINRAHRDTSSVVTLLENMAAGGNVLGSTFEDLRDTIALIENKSRVGVCLDTCHAFAAGYDLRAPIAFQATMTAFEQTVGLEYLRALHMNDSKAPFASHRDLHANIGTGFLGLRSFHNIVNDCRFNGLPLILETPIDAKDEDGVPLRDEKGKEKEDKSIWSREIKLLESLVGMDPDGEEFLRLETALARKGEPERRRLQEQLDRKREKADLKEKKKTIKKRRKLKEESSDSDLSDLEDDV